MRTVLQLIQKRPDLLSLFNNNKNCRSGLPTSESKARNYAERNIHTSFLFSWISRRLAWFERFRQRTEPSAARPASLSVGRSVDRSSEQVVVWMRTMYVTQMLREFEFKLAWTWKEKATIVHLTCKFSSLSEAIIHWSRINLSLSSSRLGVNACLGSLLLSSLHAPRN